MDGVKHIVQCRCFLPQHRSSANPPFHKFPVFSVVDDSDNVVPKIVECLNCGAVHRVKEIGISDILTGRDSSPSSLSKEDIKVSLPQNITSVLDSYNVDLATWEEVSFILENGLYRSVILKQETSDGVTAGKVLKFVGGPNIRIESFTREDEVDGR